MNINMINLLIYLYKKHSRPETRPKDVTKCRNRKNIENIFLSEGERAKEKEREISFFFFILSPN